MKFVNIRLSDDAHKELKFCAVNQNTSVQSIVAELIKKYLETKKEQSR